MRQPKPKPLQYDEVGEWSELKLEILKKYATAYSTILCSKRLSHAYIDGFAGAGVHISKRTKELIPESPPVLKTFDSLRQTGRMSMSLVEMLTPYFSRKYSRESVMRITAEHFVFWTPMAYI